ncbi:aminotransferase class III-fold pyridoxal phosphate-dependent enzyme [Actinokineospora cianjurensis]|uniref:Neamine transaminase/2'-deamino-2'-hydroxyneamine transaminase/neomycin C transaminase/aminotransferase MxcL n=1 Tax=Actinokineospora cianjurensis TaxID=585224 RepID=A0A421B1H4_9PSEU|nr:aminotransferase class III-fold pyridoxal phosphate-dependent enzyme [Actinokineospora cianjurensis]RLK58210.1 neamine transaminase/2'-deamino-2'-hydroxyneamine transaminase/neomycin C transaminase/aminotransferase MxcL [Actinokineospora cianjurensis]
MTDILALGNLETLERARRVTAAEQYDIGSRFPVVIEAAEGSWMRDVEGNRILDVTAASGALLLGNQHPAVVEAVVDAVRNHGAVFATTLSPQRVELADRLTQRYPAAEKAVFCKTGSESTTTAIRLARAATDRDLVLTSGYHGWHDWQLSYLKMGFEARTRVVNFGYNETALRRLLEEFADEIACVFVTPEPAWFDVDYYRRLSDLCRAHGVLFALDEVITGLRWGARGLNGTGGVPADIVTISKGLGNGHSIASVLGRADVINAYDKAGICGTYTREVPPMAAALAVLDVVADGSVHARTEEVGAALRSRMHGVLTDAGIPAHVAGPPMMFDVILESDDLARDIFRAAFDHGVYFEDSGTQMITAAWGDAEVDHAVDAFEKAVREVLSRTDYRPGAVTNERKIEFATEAFGGELVDDAALLAKIDETVAAIAGRERDSVVEPPTACG